MADVDALLRQGNNALKSGDLRAAGEACRKILSLEPGRKEAHFLIGLVATELQDWRTATSGFGSATKIDPQDAAAWSYLARTYLRLGLMVKGSEAIERALELGSDNPAILDLMGMTLSLLGQQERAESCYKRAFAGEPDNQAFGVNLATTQTYLGDSQAAAETLQRVLSLNEKNAQAHWILSSLQKAQSADHADRLMEMASGAPLSPAVAFLAYAAGKEYEDCEQWDAAFSAFTLGAKAKRASVEFDEEAEVQTFAALERVFTGDWTNGLNGGCQDPSPIFILGQPRTGTTLVERLITSHTDVGSAGELQQFGLSVRRLVNVQSSKRLSPEIVDVAASLDFTQLGEEYLRASSPMMPDTPRFVDKLPANFLYVPLILAALPNARIIHLTRDPMDSCFSSYKQLFADAYLHSYDQEEMTRHFVRYRKLMDHWRTTFTGRFLDVSYESVVSDLEQNARRIIEYLGLPWQNACLEFHNQSSAVATASAVQVREKAHTRSVGRWKRYESHLEPMRSILSASDQR